MYNTIPDILRKAAVESLFGTNTFKKCWNVWRGEISERIGANYSENDLINLGDHLSSIFRSTGEAGRGQGDCLG